MVEVEYINYLLFVLGLLLGSFLNVVSLRYKSGNKIFDLKRIGGRSHCPHCGKELGWYELIPIISFLMQGGRCRACRRRISLQYPVVEFLSGLTLFFVPFVFSQFYAGWFYFFVVSVWVLVFLAFILLSIIDFRQFIIPDAITFSIGFLGAALVVARFFSGNFGMFDGSFIGAYAITFGLRGNIFVNHLTAAFGGFIFFALIYFLTKGKAMGMGDVKLAFALGLLMGWPDAILALLISFIIGAIYSLGLILMKGKRLRDHIPFGPFMALGAVFIFFFGQHFLDAYFKLSALFL